MIVYIEPSAGGRKIEAYTLALMKQWGIGHSGRNDGIGIFVFIDESAFRIVVGTGIEKKVPNALTQKAINEDIVPAFQDRRLHGD